MSKTFLISPYSRKIFDNTKENAKNYPYWEELVKLLKLNISNCYIIQVGVTGEKKIDGVNECRFDLKIEYLKKLLDECHTWISVDNFFHHFAHYYKKYGFVIFSKSDPKIFGYEENINILKSSKYIRPPNETYNFWSEVDNEKESFSSAQNVCDIIVNNLSNILD